MPGRTIAIGDVHGCSVALAALLDLIRPRPDDTIVTLGDYINRGPDSRGVLDRLIALAGQCRLVPILGNHDESLRDLIRSGQPAYWWLGGDDAEDLGSFVTQAQVVPVSAAQADFLAGCRDFHETDAHIFTHGNYEADRPMAEQADETLRWLSLREATPGPHDSGKTVFVGHTAQKSGAILDLGHLVCIDTYCWGGGRLTALEVDTRRVWRVDREGRPRQ